MLKRDVFHNDLVRYIWRAAIPHISLMGRAWAAKTKFLQNNQLSLKDSMQQLIHYLWYQKLLQKTRADKYWETVRICAWDAAARVESENRGRVGNLKALLILKLSAPGEDDDDDENGDDDDDDDEDDDDDDCPGWW